MTPIFYQLWQAVEESWTWESRGEMYTGQGWGGGTALSEHPLACHPGLGCHIGRLQFPSLLPKAGRTEQSQSSCFSPERTGCLAQAFSLLLSHSVSLLLLLP